MANQDESQDDSQLVATNEETQETSEEVQGGETQEAPQEPQAEEQAPEGHEESGEAQEPTDPPQPTHSRDKRMERLSNKLREANQQADYYRNQLFENTGYKPLEYEAKDYSLDELEKDRKQYGQEQFNTGMSLAQQRIEQERFIDRLENDGERVAQKYSILNEESEEFDPDLTQTVNELYLASVGARFDQNGNLIGITNPSVRYRDYVEAYMASAERLAASRNADTARNVATQASRAGVRPTSKAKQGMGEYEPGKILNMSDEDYEKNRGAIMADINRQLGI